MAAFHGAKFMLQALMLLGVVAIASSSLIAIDLGSEFLKVSLIKPGRTPISIVVNEVSKRKSSALVGFVNGERLVGEEAVSMAVRYPDTMIAMARDLLGKAHDDPTIANILKDHALPYKVVEHPLRKVAGIQITEDQILSPEELVASTLQYVMRISEEHAGSEVKDCVLTVPAWFGQAHRQAYMNAAELAGFNVIGMINSHTAAALQYGIERDFANKTENIILYDMGSASTEVALIKYSSYTVKENGKPKQLSQLEVRDVDWDHRLGSNQLDVTLMNHFAAIFAEKNKIDLAELKANVRAMTKLKKQVRRTKEMLSANQFAPISVEEFYNGIDFSSTISREEFEVLAKDFFDRAAAPLLRVLERSGLKPENITGVELLGGGSRVPRVMAVLSEALEGRNLDRHLDSDEASVMGAGLFAANLSTSFRLRKFGMTDLTMYGIEFHTQELHQGTQEPLEDGTMPEESPKVRALLPYMKKLPIKRAVHFTNLTKGPLRFSLSYNTSTHHGLPPGVSDPALAEFKITGIEKAIERYNSSGVVNLRFHADHSGVLRLDKAEASVDYIVMEEKIVNIESNNTNSTNSTNSTGNVTIEEPSEKADKPEGEGSEGEEEAKPTEDAPEDESSKEEAKPTEDAPEGEVDNKEGADADDAPEADAESKSDAKEGEKAKEEGEKAEDSEEESGVKDTKNSTVQKILVPKKKNAKVQLKIGGAGWQFPHIAGESLKLAEDTLDAWVKAEISKRETAAAKNDLEAYIIKIQSIIGNEEDVIKVTTEEMREEFSKSLMEAEDWLYEDGEHETGPVYREKLQKLKDIGNPMQRRADEMNKRPGIVTAAREAVELNLKVVNLWSDTKPWISEAETVDVTKKMTEFTEWLEGKEKEQAEKADHEDAAFAVDDVKSKFQKMDKLYQKISNKKKPRPPPESKKEKKEETDGEEGDDAKEGGDAKDEDGKTKADGKEDETKDATDEKVDPKKAEKEKKEKADPKKEKKEKADPKKVEKEKKEKADKEKKEKADPKKAEKEKKDKADKEKKAKAKKDKDAKAKKEKDAKAKKEKEAKDKKDKADPKKAEKEKKDKADKEKKDKEAKDKKRNNKDKKTEL